MKRPDFMALALKAAASASFSASAGNRTRELAD
ncbi:nucleoside deaminase, partial [Mesorhizobium sp. M7A.F.Ca.US.001.01.1.1]